MDSNSYGEDNYHIFIFQDAGLVFDVSNLEVYEEAVYANSFHNSFGMWC